MFSALRERALLVSRRTMVLVRRRLLPLLRTRLSKSMPKIKVLMRVPMEYSADGRVSALWLTRI